MRDFLLAICIWFVIRCLSLFAIRQYVKSKQTEEELVKKPGFHTAVLVHVINDILMKISVAVLLALGIKTFLL